MRRLLLIPAVVVVLLVAARVAHAQKMIPNSPYTTPVNIWTSTHGAIFDGGFTIGTAGSLDTDTLGANECAARFAAVGYDNERSPVVLVLDDTAYTRVIGFAMEWVAMDGGALADGGASPVISFNQTPLVYGLWWRAYASGSDAGLPWFFVGSFSITGSGGPTARAMMRLTNSVGTTFPPGFNCFVPLATGVGVSKVFQRVNTIRVPVTQPR
jgi:hypothetical protein